MTPADSPRLACTHPTHLLAVEKMCVGLIVTRTEFEEGQNPALFEACFVRNFPHMPAFTQLGRIFIANNGTMRHLSARPCRAVYFNLVSSEGAEVPEESSPGNSCTAALLDCHSILFSLVLYGQVEEQAATAAVCRLVDLLLTVWGPGILQTTHFLWQQEGVLRNVCKAVVEDAPASALLCTTPLTRSWKDSVSQSLGSLMNAMEKVLLGPGLGESASGMLPVAAMLVLCSPASSASNENARPRVSSVLAQIGATRGPHQDLMMAALLSRVSRPPVLLTPAVVNVFAYRCTLLPPDEQQRRQMASERLLFRPDGQDMINSGFVRGGMVYVDPGLDPLAVPASYTHGEDMQLPVPRSAHVEQPEDSVEEDDWPAFVPPTAALASTGDILLPCPSSLRGRHILAVPSRVIVHALGVNSVAGHAAVEEVGRQASTLMLAALLIEKVQGRVEGGVGQAAQAACLSLALDTLGIVQALPTTGLIARAT